jgi:hypothetical protein
MAAPENTHNLSILPCCTARQYPQSVFDLNIFANRHELRFRAHAIAVTATSNFWAAFFTARKYST